ncbi:hypothetical protein OSB04_028060 [Centaurea solstitialis]|uniref:Alpha-N-acetylglucosaminidase N-terminal domain-containing protein n=1 Tax=Centaurea solstitialis TaxID=347529 RepID=A0AA38SGI8_9ASTR|nr:hypothetical protein OSB04_028060 [Centaurea solstitialis]
MAGGGWWVVMGRWVVVDDEDVSEEEGGWWWCMMKMWVKKKKVVVVVGGCCCLLIKSASFCSILIRIRGVTGVELLTGLHWYLKNLCGAHISWDKTGGSQLSSVPKAAGSLPRMQDDGLRLPTPIFPNLLTF